MLEKVGTIGESIEEVSGTVLLPSGHLALINDSGKSQMNRDIMNAISSCEFKKRFIKTDIETIITLNFFKLLF